MFFFLYYFLFVVNCSLVPSSAPILYRIHLPFNFGTDSFSTKLYHRLFPILTTNCHSIGFCTIFLSIRCCFLPVLLVSLMFILCLWSPFRLIHVFFVSSEIYGIRSIFYLNFILQMFTKINPDIATNFHSFIYFIFVLGSHCSFFVRMPGEQMRNDSHNA